MSVIDTPDGQYPVVGGQVLLGTGIVGTPIGVTLPANSESLLIFVQETELPASPPLVQGVTSSLYYPVTFLDYVNVTSQTSVWAVMVSSAIDTVVRVAPNGSAGAGFYVVADSGVRLIGDLVTAAASAAPGSALPNLAQLMGGSDGTDLRALRTDSSGQLLVSIGSMLNPATTVTGPDAYGASAVVGTSLDYAREDHDHGLPSAPSSGLTSVTAFIASNVTVGASPTNIESVSLVAGTWLITGRLLYENGGGTNTDFWLGPDSASATAAYAGTSSNVSGTASVVVNAVIVLATTTTVYLEGISTSGSSLVTAASSAEGIGKGTGIIALKIG